MSILTPAPPCFYSRRALELAVTWLFECDRSLCQLCRTDLSAFLFEPSFKALVATALHTKLDIIRKLGNLAAHSSKSIRTEDAIASVCELFHFCYWLSRNYGLRTTDKPAANARFMPKTSPIPTQNQTQLQQLREEIAQVKTANAAQPDTHDYTEAETRDYFIDLLLKG